MARDDSSSFFFFFLLWGISNGMAQKAALFFSTDKFIHSLDPGLPYFFLFKASLIERRFLGRYCLSKVEELPRISCLISTSTFHHACLLSGKSLAFLLSCFPPIDWLTARARRIGDANRTHSGLVLVRTNCSIKTTECLEVLCQFLL
jgi:hypothetical protein